MSLTHIETIELGSSQASITFSSIPQDYDDLVVKLSLRNDRNDTGADARFEINGSSTGFTCVILKVFNGAVSSETRSDTFVLPTVSANATSNTFSNNQIYFSNYTGSTEKSMSLEGVAENNSSNAYRMNIVAAKNTTTSSITSLEFIAGSGLVFVAGTIISLFGVTAGGSGTVTTA